MPTLTIASSTATLTAMCGTKTSPCSRPRVAEHADRAQHEQAVEERGDVDAEDQLVAPVDHEVADETRAVAGGGQRQHGHGDRERRPSDGQRRRADRAEDVAAAAAADADHEQVQHRTGRDVPEALVEPHQALGQHERRDAHERGQEPELLAQAQQQVHGCEPARSALSRASACGTSPGAGGRRPRRAARPCSPRRRRSCPRTSTRPRGSSRCPRRRGCAWPPGRGTTGRGR